MRIAGFYGALCFAGIFATSCSEFWGGETKPDPGNCVAISDLCSPGQHCNQLTEACEFDGTNDDGGLPGLPAAPVSFVLPGGAGGVFTMQTTPRDANYVLVAQDPNALIYYTTDGSVPTPGSPGTQRVANPAMISAVPTGTTIRWFGDYGADFAPEPVHLFTATTNPTPPPDFGYIPEAAKLGPNAVPLVTVGPGEMVSGSLNYQAWMSTSTGYCPGCFVQYAVSLETVGVVGCVEDIELDGPYPGINSTLNFSFNAPMTPGRYKLYSGLTLEFSCDGSVAGGPDIGEVIVQQ